MADPTRNDHSRPPGAPPESGAPGGLALIFVEHRATLLRFLTRRLGSDQEAEDALQDVWIKLSENPPTGPIADPLAYLLRMGENAARDLRRSDARRHTREGVWAETHAAGEFEGQNEPSPEEVAIQRERLREVEGRLMLLPERTRRIFIAFRLEGTRQKQIATDFGISHSAVQKHLQRAYRAVLELSEKEDFQEFDNSGARKGPS